MDPSVKMKTTPFSRYVHTGRQTRLTDSEKRRRPWPIEAGGPRRRPGRISRRRFAARTHRPLLNVPSGFVGEHRTHWRLCSIDNRTHQNRLHGIFSVGRVEFLFRTYIKSVDSMTGSIWFSLKPTALLAAFSALSVRLFKIHNPF